MVHTNINTASTVRNARSLPPHPPMPSVQETYLADTLAKILAENVAIRADIHALLKEVAMMRSLIEEIDGDWETEH